MLRGGDEVGEGVALVQEAAVVVPAAPVDLTAANVGDGEDESTVDEAEPRRTKAGVDGGAVGTVAVQE